MFKWFAKRGRSEMTPPSGPRVDVHCHLLPGVDDGCASENDAFACIEGMVGLGYRGAVLTPHINPAMFPNEPAGLTQRFGVFKQHAAERYPGFELALAAEYMVHESLASDMLKQPGSILTFGQGRTFVLVELPPDAPPALLQPVLDAAAAHGWTLVIAHVERYAAIQEDRDDAWIDRWKRAGAWVQVNLGSLTGVYGPGCEEAANRLLESRRIDLLGTDLHRPKPLARGELIDAWNTVEAAGCPFRHAEQAAILAGE